MDFNLDKKIKDFDIIFTFNKESLLNKIIWFFSRESLFQKNFERKRKTAHALFYLKNGLVAEVNWEGMKIKPLRRYNTKKHIIFLGTVKRDFDSNVLIEFAERSHGKVKYDFFRLLVIAFQKLTGNHRIKDYSIDMMICIEWIITAFRAVGVDLLPGRDASNITPFDLVQSKHIALREITADKS